MMTPRELLTRFLVGSGIEIGPGHVPFPTPFPGTTVRYVDRWEPSQNKRLFPELGAEVSFGKPDIIANLDTDRLKPIADATQDFVIASHVLEHLAEPLGLLKDIHRVLRPGGVLLLLLPDRRQTFDSKRAPTPLEHLVTEHASATTEVSDEHVEDFLRGTGGWVDQWKPGEKERIFALHRARSIHVHCWSQEEFVPVLRHTISNMGLAWELLDATFFEEAANGYDFGFALRKPASHADLGVAALRLTTVFEALAMRPRRSPVQTAPPAVHVAASTPPPDTSLRDVMVDLARQRLGTVRRAARDYVKRRFQP